MADCIFCKVVSGEIPARIAKRNADAVAFYDLKPEAPVHILVIPTRHIAAVRDAKGPEGERLLGRVLMLAAEVASELKLDAGGYRLVTNTGPDAGQSVFHLHVHLLGGRRMAWPPG